MYNILICDDQPDIVNALKIYLAPEGYQLFEAFTGVQALEIVQKEDIHLILLDIMMPVMDGITATAKIREFSNVPIIFLTAKSETEDMVLALTTILQSPSFRWKCWQESVPICGATPNWAAVWTSPPMCLPWVLLHWMIPPR